MRNPLILVTLAALAAATPGLAQGKTWVVDQNSGAGSQFTDIPAAIAKAAAGDKIYVRAGTYTEFTVTKALSILGQGAVSIGHGSTITRIQVQNLPAGQLVSIQGISSYVLTLVSNCKGTVLFESCALRFALSGAASVHLNNCQVQGGLVDEFGLTAVSSNLSASGCTMAPLKLRSSAAILARCQLSSYLVSWYVTKRQAPLDVDVNSVVALTDDGTTSVDGTNPAVSPLVYGGGTVLIDPRVVFRTPAGGLLYSGVTVLKHSMPLLDARGAKVGGTATVKVRSAAKEYFTLALGLPGGPISIPSFRGTLWIDPNTLTVVLAGQLDTKGAYDWSMTMPNIPALLGLPLTWQGIAGPTLSNQTLTNPSSYVHGI